MGFIIEDGRGTGNKAGVSISGERLDVSSRSDDRIYYISRDNEDAYSVTSVDTAAAGEYNLYFQNTSTTQKFYVRDIVVGSAALAIFKLSVVSGTAAGGSELTPVNLNLTSGKTASANCRGNGAVTGLSEVAVIDCVSVAADTSKIIDLHDALVLGQNDAIAVEYDTGAGATMHATLFGFFDVE